MGIMKDIFSEQYCVGDADIKRIDVYCMLIRLMSLFQLLRVTIGLCEGGDCKW